MTTDDVDPDEASACVGKQSFASRSLARKVIGKQLRSLRRNNRNGKSGGSLVPFHCVYCGAYHIGNSRKTTGKDGGNRVSGDRRRWDVMSDDRAPAWTVMETDTVFTPSGEEFLVTGRTAGPSGKIVLHRAPVGGGVTSMTLSPKAVVRVRRGGSR